VLDALKIRIAAGFLQGLVKSLATDTKTRCTIVGTIAGVILAIHGLDYGQLVSGNPQQIALVVSAVAVWGIGVLAADQGHDGHTTFLGLIAAAAQAYMGNFATAATLGLCGYFTGKAPAAVTSDASPIGRGTGQLERDVGRLVIGGGTQ
jgi:hypothetical protein